MADTTLTTTFDATTKSLSGQYLDAGTTYTGSVTLAAPAITPVATPAAVPPAATPPSVTPVSLTAAQWRDQLPKDANGFAAPAKTAGYRTIYVSTSAGSDANAGTLAAPVATFKKAFTLVRDKSDDEIRLLRGDLFDPWNVAGGGLPMNGGDPLHPFVFTSYGDPTKPRPVLTTQLGVSGKNVLFRDLDFTCSLRNYTKAGYQDSIGNQGNCGLSEINDYLWVENCRFQFFPMNVILQPGSGQLSRLVFRRNVVAFSWGGVHASGIYTENISDWTLQENLFWHNGYALNPLAGPAQTDAPRTIFSHNAYLQEDSAPGDFSSNLSADASSHGCQQRSGGTQNNNIFFRNPYGSFVARNPSSVTGNIYDSSALIPGASGGSPALEIIGCSAPVTNCIFLNNTAVPPGPCVQATPSIAIDGAATVQTPAAQVQVTGCIAKGWTGAGTHANLQSGQTWTGLTDTANDWPGTASYVDPTRNLTTYAQSISLPTPDALLAAMQNNEAATWNAKLAIPTIHDWITAGFAKK